jgi:hypothetical protein
MKIRLEGSALRFTATCTSRDSTKGTCTAALEPLASAARTPIATLLSDKLDTISNLHLFGNGTPLNPEEVYNLVDKSPILTVFQERTSGDVFAELPADSPPLL